MGNFYGQVMYEFTKMFSKFMITKPSTSETPIAPPADAKEKFFEATTMWEQFNIEPTNRWIQIDGEGGNDDIKTIKVGHGTPGATDVEKTFISLEKAETEEEEITQLKNSDIIKISTLTHDAAGHVNNSPTHTYYKLPPPTQLTIVTSEEKEDSEENITPSDDDVLSVKGDGQWISLINDGNALKIAHDIIEANDLDEEQKTSFVTFNCLIPDDRKNNNLSPESFRQSLIEVDKKTEEEANKMIPILNNLNSDEVIIPLQSGDLIQGYDIVKDINGHMVGIKPTYFKMPVSATDVAFDDQKNRISAIEQLLIGGDDGELPEVNPDYSYAKIAEKIDEIGDLQDIYNNPDEKTIVDAIGQITGENSVTAAINRLTGNADDIITISTAIQKLVDKVRYQETIIALIADKLDIQLS